jgi:hypothetical protein
VNPGRSAQTTDKNPITVEEYLAKLAAMAGDPFGRQIREHFKDIRGSSELGMLASPTPEELEQLTRAVAIMTPAERAGAHELSDTQVILIASDAGVNPAMLAIFINGYALERRKNRK